MNINRPIKPNTNSATVALTKPSAGIPSSKILTTLPAPTEKYRTIETNVDVYDNFVMRAPNIVSKPMPRYTPPEDLISFRRLAFPPRSIPFLAVKATGVSNIEAPTKQSSRPAKIRYVFSTFEFFII